MGFAPRRSGVTVDPEQGAVEKPCICRNGEKLRQSVYILFFIPKILNLEDFVDTKVVVEISEPGEETYNPSRPPSE